jgi:hypothetical protein
MFWLQIAGFVPVAEMVTALAGVVKKVLKIKVATAITHTGRLSISIV